MKVSLNWIREFLDLNKTPEEIADILTSLGLEVEGWDAVKPSPVDLDKVVTGRVLECTRIPDTDHLSATKVDVGDGIVRSIVCGAPNVGVGQHVLVALPGTNVLSKDGQLFEIGERKVRGVPSQGMICAEDELGIGHDHSGIMVLPADTPLGIPASQYLNLHSDIVYEIGLTPNRADATNHLGIASDLLAWVRHHESPNAKKRHNIPNAPDQTGSPEYPVIVENTDACHRYTGILLRGVQVKESPDWLKDRLLALGQRPINNVVDVTNYVRLELGQPLHAFDADQIHGNKIVVKTLPEGTVFKSLDGTDRKLSAQDLMICDGQSNPMCIGGVFGGATSGVSDGTTSVFLESARFNPGWIRRSMLRHGLRTDAAWCFEKGVDPNGCLAALHRATTLILELAGGTIASGITDIYPNPVQPVCVPITFERVNGLIGENLKNETILHILAALEIGIKDVSDAGFTAVIPTNKPDVTREADVIEEILRVHGLDAVPMPARMRTSMEITPRPAPDAVRNLAADFLSANGFFECMGLSLTNSAYHTDEGALLPLPKESLVFVHNTANQGLDCMRPTLLLSGLETIRHNQNRQNADLRLYEFGKTYGAPLGADSETNRLAVFVSGQHSPESWQPAAKAGADFFTLKAYVQNLLTRLGISGFQETTVQDTPFRYALRYHRGSKELVTLGQVAPAIAKKMDIKNAVFFADFNFDHVLEALGASHSPIRYQVPKNGHWVESESGASKLTGSAVQLKYQEISKYPVVRRDLALVLNQAVTFSEIRQLAARTAKKILREVNLFDVFEDESKLGAGKKSYAVSFLFEDPQKTLQDKDIDALMQQLQQAFEQKLNASIRK